MSHEIIQGKATVSLPTTWVPLQEGVNDDSNAFKKLQKLKIDYFGTGIGDGNMDVKFDEMFLFEEGRASLSFFLDTETKIKESQDFNQYAKSVLKLQFSLPNPELNMKEEYLNRDNAPLVRKFEDIEANGAKYLCLYLEFNNKKSWFFKNYHYFGYVSKSSILYNPCKQYRES